MTTEEREDDLRNAFRAVRDRYDGTHPEADLTLRRALVHGRQARRRRFARWTLLPIAAVLAAGTAWAGATGRLAPLVTSISEAFHSERAPVTAPTTQPLATVPAPSTADAATTEATNDPLPPADDRSPVTKAPNAPASDPLPAGKEPTAWKAAPPPAVTPTAAATTAEPPASAAVAPPTKTLEMPPPVDSADPNAPLFAEAHRIHFTEKDPARALAAWDRYLAAAPSGRFAPEARYNRALALVRLGRNAEATRELTGFADGTYGGYRQKEARALLDALTRDR
jgi:cytoskeletal protein RodZ